MRTSRSSLLLSLAGLLAAIAVVASLWLEVRLGHAAHRARGSLPRALAVAAGHAEDETERELLLGTARIFRAGHGDEGARMLQARTELHPTAAAHGLAAHAAAATGDFDAAARHAAFASRLAPGEVAPAGLAEGTLDLAVQGRLRGPLGTAGIVGGLGLLFLWIRRVRRGRYRRRLAEWLAHLQVGMACRVDGEVVSTRDPVLAPRSTSRLAFDFFLRPRGPLRRAPRPGPTLSVVLSQAGSNLSLRLTPQHDVRDDAVRVLVQDTTLAHLLARPGAWRLQARLDERVVGEARLEVPVDAAGTPSARLHLVGSR